jgi:formylglycine-generating enzyme required for sulfatase activity
MHGNVWEWMEDDYHGSYERAPDDGSAWINTPRGSARVIRGGSLSLVAHDCRSAARGSLGPGGRDFRAGFRLSRSVALGP